MGRETRQEVVKLPSSPPLVTATFKMIKKCSNTMVPEQLLSPIPALASSTALPMHTEPHQTNKIYRHSEREDNGSGGKIHLGGDREDKHPNTVFALSRLGRDQSQVTRLTRNFFFRKPRDIRTRKREERKRGKGGSGRRGSKKKSLIGVEGG